MFRVISLNVNGIRAASKKGFFSWVLRQQADVVCLQELKAHEDQIPDSARILKGYHAWFFPAEQKGYSGVGVYTRQRPDKITVGLGWEDMDREGRYLQVDFGSLSIASVYLPSGSSSPERQAVKYAFMERFMPMLDKFLRRRRRYILCGDWNIAHKKIDIKNWRGNQTHSGFLPEERAWMDVLFGAGKWVDAFRVVNQEADQYTWWSNRGRAWAKNVGWRIDYQVISPNLRDRVRQAWIYREERFSDHAPLTMDYDL